MKTDYYSKRIRLDFYVKDGTERCFDIEVQTSVENELALAKRTRYYQGLMDVDSVFSGTNYPAFNWANTYDITYKDYFGGVTEGWYIPSIAKQKLFVHPY